MKISFSIIKYLQKYLDEYRENKKNRIPKWFYYGIYEEEYIPSINEWLKRGTMNALLFLSSVSWIIAIGILGIRTFVFEVVKQISSNLGMPEAIWMLYGIAFGIGGSLIFCSIGNPYNSVHTRLITTLTYMAYYAFFFIVLNIIFLILAIFILWT